MRNKIKKSEGKKKKETWFFFNPQKLAISVHAIVSTFVVRIRRFSTIWMHFSPFILLFGHSNFFYTIVFI